MKERVQGLCVGEYNLIQQTVCTWRSIQEGQNEPACMHTRVCKGEAVCARVQVSKLAHACVETTPFLTDDMYIMPFLHNEASKEQI